MFGEPLMVGTLLQVDQTIRPLMMPHLNEARYIVNRDASRRFSIGRAVMGMSVDDDIDRITVEYVCQPAAAQERKDLSYSPTNVSGMGA
jgi:hypothetical protein